jgi:hypothetical protein
LTLSSSLREAGRLASRFTSASMALRTAAGDLPPAAIALAIRSPGPARRSALKLACVAICCR